MFFGKQSDKKSRIHLLLIEAHTTLKYSASFPDGSTTAITVPNKLFYRRKIPIVGCERIPNRTAPTVADVPYPLHIVPHHANNRHRIRSPNADCRFQPPNRCVSTRQDIAKKHDTASAGVPWRHPLRTNCQRG